MKMTKLIQYVPVILTVTLILWTIAVSPHSKYGDNWAIYPAVFILPIVIFWHVGLIIAYRPRIHFFLYGLLHTLILFVIWMICIMRISKDSL